MSEPVRRNLDQWAALYGVIILDPDGFDRTDPLLHERMFTQEEFEAGLYRCTILGSTRQAKVGCQDE